jgi:hypothetical protein
MRSPVDDEFDAAISDVIIGFCKFIAGILRRLVTRTTS